MIYYSARSCYDLFNALNTAVAENKASVVNNSWLYPGESIVAEVTLDRMNSLIQEYGLQ